MIPEKETKAVESENMRTEPEPTQNGITEYQRLHLRFLRSTLVLSVISVIMVAYQVNNLSNQTKRNTDAIKLQTEAIRLQTEAFKLQVRSVEEQSWHTITQQMNEITKVFIEHPELYPYFYKKKHISQKESLYPKVISMSDLFLDFMDGFGDEHVRKLSGMDDNGENWIAWQNYFQDQFKMSPTLCERFDEVRSWYAKNGVVVKFAEKGCYENNQKIAERLKNE